MAQRRGFQGRYRDDDRYRRDDDSYRTYGDDDRDEDWRARRAHLSDDDDDDRGRWRRERDDEAQSRGYGYGYARFTRPSSPPAYGRQPSYGQPIGPSNVGASIYPQSPYPSTFVEHHTGLGYGQGQTMFGGGASTSSFAQESARVPFYGHPHGQIGGSGPYAHSSVNPSAGYGSQAWPTQPGGNPSPYAGSGFTQPAHGATHYGSAPYGGQTSGFSHGVPYGQPQQQGSSGHQPSYFGQTGETQFGQNSYGTPSQKAAQGHEHDYGRWRHEQLNRLDTQYQTWRDHQARQFDDDFARYSQHRHSEFSSSFEDWRKQNQGSQPQSGPVERSTGTPAAASGLGASSGTQSWQNSGAGSTNVTGPEGAGGTSGAASGANPTGGPTTTPTGGNTGKSDKNPTIAPKH